jgi:hypothetical protein
VDRKTKQRHYFAAAMIMVSSLCLLRCGSSDDASTNDPTFPVHADSGTKGVDADAHPQSALEAAIPDACALTTLPPFGPDWQLAGNATLQGATANLAPNLKSQAGAIFYQTPIDSFRTLDATFEMRVENGDASVFKPGDGMTFAWVSSPSPPGVGANGGSLGFCGLIGGATAFDIYQDDIESEGPVPSIEVLEAPSASSCVIGEHTLTSVPAITDGSFHTTHVIWDRAANTIVVTIDSIVELSVNVNQTVTGPLYVGFTAATGGGTARFDVQNTTIVVNSCL